MFQYRRQRKTQTFASHHLTFGPNQDFVRPEHTPLVHAKLQIGIVADCYEKAVERVADQNMRSEMIQINDVSPTDTQSPGSVSKDLQHLAEVKELLQPKNQNSYNSHLPRLIPVVKIPKKNTATPYQSSGTDRFAFLFQSDCTTLTKEWTKNIANEVFFTAPSSIIPSTWRRKMSIEPIPNTDIQYYLLAYDKKGRERQGDPDAQNGGMLSERVKEELKTQPITDVFFISHGWKGDVPAAKDQYTRWISAMIKCTNDREKMRQVRPSFRPLLIGLHWPSLPWGDEALDVSSISFAPGTDPLAALVEDAADKIADTERAKEALRTIFSAALDDITPSTLPPEVVDAYKILQQEARLDGEGPAGAPGADAEEFDPELSYQANLEEVSFGGIGLGGLLSPLRQLSFWKMKARAKDFGESGAGSLLRELQEITAHRDVHFHLMGHSFGCIVVSATVAAAGGAAPLIKPVHSLFLVQGALSLWAYCSDIPVAKGKSGYFRSIISDKKVLGPIVTTQSEHDTAVGRLYPLAAGIKSQVVFVPGELPKYGGLGSFGIRGPEVSIEDLDMLPTEGHYGFQKGRCYNLESSKVIRQGGGVSGAHSDIDHPEVAHAFWEAVMV